MKSTIPLNAFIQAAVGGYFSTLCPIKYIHPLAKFRPFRTRLPIPDHIDQKKTKQKALFIANCLFDKGIVWCNKDGVRQKFLTCDHLCDSLLQAFTELPPLPPTSSSEQETVSSS